jgi:CHAT domain-containing protein/tetratricopeptide (TPR) repeat protein
MRTALGIIFIIVLLNVIPLSKATAAERNLGEELLRIELNLQLDEAYDLVLAWYPDSALTLCESLPERARAEFGETDSTYSRALDVLATCYYYLGDYVRSEGLWQEALMLREKIFEPGDYRINNLYLRLGQTYRRMIRLDKAEEYLTRALELWEKYLGRDSKKYGSTKGELGSIYMMRGDFRKAETFLEQWAEISRNVLGEDHPNYGFAMETLAEINCRYGRWKQAEQYYQNGLTIFEKVNGPVHPWVANLLMGLGDIRVEQGRFSEAEAYYDRALDIRQQFFQDNHHRIAQSCAKIAVLNAYQGRYARAESLFNRAIDIYIDVNGPEHTKVCEALRQLGIMIANHGRYQEGKALIERSLNIRLNAQGPNHYRIPSCYYNLALVSCYLRDYGSGREYYEKLLQSRRRFLEVIFAGASEEQKLRYMSEYSIMEHSLYSMAMKDGSMESRGLALKMLLNGKAFVLDAVAAEKEAAHCSYDADIKNLVDRLSSVYREIANLTISGGGDLESEIFDRHLKALYDSKDSLETVLSDRCSDYKNIFENGTISTKDIAEAIPPDAVLWEIARYRPFDLGPRGSFFERTGKPRYLAFTLNHAGDIDLVDLGDTFLIDSLIQESLDKIRKAPEMIYSGNERQSELELNRITAQLYDLVFAPLSGGLNDNAHIFISPAGNLNLFPLEILPLPDGKYVVEKYHLSYLSSGRDLLKFEDDNFQPGRGAMVVADPDFDMNLIVDNNSNSIQPAAVNLSAYLPVRASNCLAEYLSPLPETYVEGQTITGLLNRDNGLNVRFFYGSEASEELLKNIDSPPEILHLATHSYFCPEITGIEGEGPYNPLLESGLVMAGANRIIDDHPNQSLNGEDGILTSLEISALNLTNTDLVVLSACQTGVGEIVGGEGVFGMRRAFQHAGARTIVMSLWPVPDRQTRELMENLYRNWLAGNSKSTALRKASLDIISKRRDKYGASHPLFWGGFILLGDPE